MVLLRIAAMRAHSERRTWLLLECNFEKKSAVEDQLLKEVEVFPNSSTSHLLMIFLINLALGWSTIFFLLSWACRLPYSMILWLERTQVTFFMAVRSWMVNIAVWEALECSKWEQCMQKRNVNFQAALRSSPTPNVHFVPLPDLHCFLSFPDPWQKLWLGNDGGGR